MLDHLQTRLVEAEQRILLAKNAKAAAETAAENSRQQLQQIVRWDQDAYNRLAEWASKAEAAALLARALEVKKFEKASSKCEQYAGFCMLMPSLKRNL